jgi:excisionase family DNA binding protein
MFAKLPKECVPEVEIATFMDEVERNNGTRTQLGKELYTINEVAEMFSMDRVTVYRMINRGELPYISLGEGRTRRIAREDIDAWVSKSRQYY